MTSRAASCTASLLVHKRLVREIDQYAGRTELVVLPPPCPLAVDPRDFSRAGELIDRAYRDAVAALAVDGGRRSAPSTMIAMHTHRRRPHDSGGSYQRL